ncbi:uncharacterized protein LOC113775820 [Coffea eugenioides]|uniref:uncharacterized protein LOC113775820 n=1 Tax=Coffea eugenioides TaxID=49369 RepID=UPI000F60F5AC|nr:uncharacterized protein LOC113775820 [Coffea eugenioides]
MKPVVHKDKEKKEKVEIRADCRAEEGRKHVERVQVKTRDVDTLKYIERKLIDKGVQRMERHPADGLPLKHDPKKGHGGKYSWEGPDEEFMNELQAAPAIDEKDPNYVDEEAEARLVKPGESAAGDDDDEGGVVVGEVEAPKLAEEGVARIEVHPHSTG